MFVLGLVASVASLSATADSPQTDRSSADADIIVTGERLDRTLQDTASSVDVVTAKELDQRQPDRIEQVLALTPNVQLGSGDSGPTIRGQDTQGVLRDADAFLGGTRPRATIQIDGRALGANEYIYGLSSVWDVERIEVFRTPQTTTQGRNSIAGAIFIKTEDPTFTPKFRGRVIVGNYDTVQLSGAASGPIVSDQVALRLAIDRRESRTSSQTLNAIPGIDNRDDNYTVGRAKLLVTPTALPGLRLDITYQHLASQSPQAVTVRPPFELRRNVQDAGAVWRTNVDSLTGVAQYALSADTKLTVTGAYGDSEVRRISQAGQGVARVKGHDFSIEGIIASKPLPGIELLGGVYHLATSQRETIDLSAFIGFGNFRDRQNSLGLFGEATAEVLPRLKLTLGGRYQRDHQDRDGFLGTDAFGFAVNYDRTFEAFLPKAAVAYELSDRFTIGLLAQRATNPGGTTISFETGQQDQFDAERLYNYEAFVRARLMDGKLRLQGNVFYTDFENAQRPLTTVVTRQDGTQGLTTQVANAPDARSYGVEAEVTYAPTSTFSISGGVGLLNTKITRVLDASDPILGRDFSRAPHFSGTLAMTWQPTTALTLSSQVRHNGRYFSDDANTPSLAITGSTILDAKASYAIGPLQIFAYARNVLDHFYLTQLYQPDFGSVGDPREFGAGLEVRF